MFEFSLAMKKTLLVASILACTVTAHAEKIFLEGGTVIDPASGRIFGNTTVVLEGDHIAAVNEVITMRHSEQLAPKTIDCAGKFILPGYIDTHVHFFQSGDIYTRPDAVDLNGIRPYKDEVEWVKSHVDDVFARYLRCGITSVVDVGGPLWNFEVRKKAHETAKAPRVAAAGPLISSVSRPQLDLGDPPIVQVNTPDDARAMVRKLAAYKPDYIKIWYIVSPPASAGTTPAPGLGTDVERAAVYRPVVHAVVEESHKLKLKVAVHATELEAARNSVEEGADLLVHSVTDRLVDDAFVRLLKEKKTILTPTLVVFERYGRAFSHQLNFTPEEQKWGNPDVIASLDVTKIPADQVPDRIKTALADPAKVLDRIKQTYDVALKNLKTLEDAGVTIAAGTDAGNIGTIHGPALFREFQLMKEAGLTPMQILRCTTVNAARVFDGETGPLLGSIEKGKLADLVVLNSNPVDDIAHASDIAMVIKNGVVYQADDILSK